MVEVLMVPLSCLEQKGRSGRGARAWFSNTIMMQIIKEGTSPASVCIQSPDPGIQSEIA